MPQIVVFKNGAKAQVVEKKYKNTKVNRDLGRVGETYKRYQIISGPTK